MGEALLRSDGPLGWDDLPALDAAAVALRNADLAQLGRRVFALGGVAVRFHQAALPPQGAARAEGGLNDPAAQEPAVWLWLEWAGVPLLAGVSEAWAGAVAQSLAGLGLDALGEPGLDLLCQLQLAPRLPAGLILRQAARSRGHLEGVPGGLTFLGCWAGLHHASGEPSEHTVQLWAPPGLAVQALLAAFVPLARETLPSPLAGVPIALPLVAARWPMDAVVLQDLSVGDVLILG